jgi:hypothetical protein
MEVPQSYNVLVPSLLPPSQPNPHSRLAAEPAKRRNRSLEARGLLILAMIILLISLLRYWHNFAWGAR